MPVKSRKGEPTKWKTPEARQEACKSYCKHIASGYSKDSWPDADFETVQRYIRDFPEDFSPEEVRRAERVSRLFWEGLGIDGTRGKIKGFNAKSWEFNMQNRLGWHTNAKNTLDGQMNTTQNLSDEDRELISLYLDILSQKEPRK